MQRAIRKPGLMQGRPETITGSSEVMTGGARVQAGVDAAKQYPQAGRDHIRDALAVRGGKLRLARSA
jgi:hypothetical protein